MDTARKYDKDFLSDRLHGARKQINKKVEDYLEIMAIKPPNILAGDIMATNKYIKNTVTNSTFAAPLVITDDIQNSFNTLEQGAASGQVKELVGRLLEQISEQGELLKEKNPNVSDDAKALANEVSKPEPRRKWYELSISGIREAAEAVGEVGAPILKTIGTLLPLLTKLYL